MIILASKSPRRKELLKKIYPSFCIRVSDKDEMATGDTPEEKCVSVAIQKALTVEHDENDVVIAADTMVYMDGRYFGKPKDRSDAIDMLKTLSGKTHYVYTGFAILFCGKVYKGYDVSEVKFKTLSDDDILSYIASGSPFDKAGAYGIQDGVVVESYKGSFDNIMGFPTEKIKEKLMTIGAV